mmetsp:Transcript_3301/g.7774  ORF Transcript_3301/g.7774 Transcript_3301/m.7774 type:complete len:180 (-) Transcript_3301:11-550(-)
MPLRKEGKRKKEVKLGKAVTRMARKKRRTEQGRRKAAKQGKEEKALQTEKTTAAHLQQTRKALKLAHQHQERRRGRWTPLIIGKRKSHLHQRVMVDGEDGMRRVMVKMVHRGTRQKWIWAQPKMFKMSKTPERSSDLDSPPEDGTLLAVTSGKFEHQDFACLVFISDQLHYRFRHCVAR